MKKLVLSLALAFSAIAVQAAITSYHWKKDSAGSWSGCITNEEHWANGVVPYNNARMWFDSSMYADYSLSFPEGVYTNYASFLPSLYGTRTLSIDGQNTIWVHPENTDGAYHTTQFAVYMNTTVRDFVCYSLSGATPNPGTAPNLVISNFLITASSTGARHGKVVFEKGFYEFLNPCGHWWTWSIQKPTFYVFNFNSNDASASADLFDLAEVEFKPGTVLRVNDVAINGNATSNVLTFAGSQEIATVDMPGRYDGQEIRVARTVTDVIFDNATLLATNRFNMGGDGRVTNRLFRTYFRNKSQAELPSMYFQRGELEFNIDDSTVTFGRKGGHSQNLSYDTVKSLKFNITNGGKLINNQGLNGQGFYFGTDTATERRHWFNVEDSTLQIVSGGKMAVYGSEFSMKNSVFDIPGGTFYAKGGTELNPVDMSFDHTFVTNNSALYMLSSGYGSVLFTNDTEVVFSKDWTIGGEGLDAASKPTRATVNMYGGRFLGTTTGGSLYIGYSANSDVTFNMYGGVISNSVSGQGISIGEGGCTKFNMYGGVINTFNPRLASNAKTTYDYTDQDPTVWTIYDGLVVSRNAGNGETSGFAIGGQYANSYRKAKLVLNGGVVESYTTFGGMNAACRGGNGRAMLEANGGTLRLPCDSPCTVFLMDEAKLGPKGLTIDSNGYNATIKQHLWANKDGEEGSLIFTGAGTKCPTGNVEQVSNIVLAGGVTDLSKVDNLTVNNLIVTNGATLKLDPSKTLIVKGTLTLDGASLMVSANCTVGQTYNLFKFTTEPSAAVKTAIANLKYPSGVAGLGSNRTCDLEVVSDGEGGFVTRMAVREAQTLTMSWPEGVSNATDNVNFDPLDTLAVDVGLSGALKLSGIYQYGFFKMIGPGAVEISDWTKLLTQDFKVKQGVLNITEPAAGLTTDRQIVLAHESTNDVFIINNTVDVKMPVPYGTNQNGEFIKRGPGRLVWEVEGTKNFLGGYGKSKINNSMWSWAVENIGQLTFDTVSGMVTTSGVPPLVVAEGELVLKGKGSNPRFVLNGCSAIGTSTKVGTVQPGLVVDGVYVYQNNYPHRRLNVGCALNYSIAGRAYRTGDVMLEPYLILTNGATYYNDTLDLNRFCMGSSVHTRVDVDNSKLYCSYQILINRAQDEDPHATLTARNNAKVQTPWLAAGYPSVMEFDNSSLEKNDAGDCLVIKPESEPSSSGQLDARFRNNSIFRCCVINPSTMNPTGKDWRKPFTLLFDNSDWYPTNGANSVTLEWANPQQLYIVTTNQGLRFPVPATATWTVKQPINGTGDLVNSGKGTLALGTNAVAYTGTTFATDADGVVDFGGEPQNTFIGGAGTFQNGTLIGGISLRNSQVPTIASTMTLSGTTKVQVLDATPLAPGAQFEVLNYQGAAPQASQFRLVRKGAASGLSGVFTVDGGTVTCTISEAPGAMLIVR